MSSHPMRSWSLPRKHRSSAGMIFLVVMMFVNALIWVRENAPQQQSSPVRGVASAQR